MNDNNQNLLSELTKLHTSTVAIINRDMDLVSDECLSGAVAQINAAKQDLLRIEDSIHKLVMVDSAAIFPLGPLVNQKKFADLAEEEGCMTFSGMELYDELARMVLPFLRNDGVFTFETGRAIIAALTKIANNLGALSFMAPLVHQHLNETFTPDTLVVMIKNLVRKSNNDSFNALYLSQKVFERVVDSKYEANVVTVVVTGLSEDEAKGDLATCLFSGHTVTVDVTEAPEKADVLSVAKTIKRFYSRVATVQASLNASKARAAKAAKQN